MKERLHKFLAASGIGSRRYCEELIRAGRVTVDGTVAQIGSSVNLDEQKIAVDGKAISSRSPLHEYWLLNKPKGIVSTVSDPQGRPTVIDKVPTKKRIFPVGRLDINTTGLLLLTNDGELTAKLLHPRYQVEKEYIAIVRGVVSTEEIARLRHGVELEDGLTAPAQVTILESKKESLKQRHSGRLNDSKVFDNKAFDNKKIRLTTTLLVTLHEGRKRQVRRMLEEVGHTVIALHRRSFASLTDEGLPVGQVRQLTSLEVEKLKRLGDRRYGKSGNDSR